MKKVFFLISAILLLAISCVKENKPTDQNDPTDIVNTYIDINSITFKKVDLQGVNTLALASPGASSNKVPRTKADGEAGSYLLYKVDENGILTEIEYTIIIESRTIVENPGADSTAVATEEVVAYDSIKANLKLAMEYVYTIGTKWLWLYNCSYYCEDLETIENEQAREAVSRIIFEFGSGHSFLVRRTDGALFPWDDVSNPLFANGPSDWPWGTEGLPSQNNIEQVVISMEEDIVTRRCVDKGNDLYTLYSIEDDGDILKVNQLLNEGIYSTGGIVPIPGEYAFHLRLSHAEGKEVIMFTKTCKMTIVTSGNLVEGEDLELRGFVAKEQGLYGLFYSNQFLQDQSKLSCYLVLESSGEQVKSLIRDSFRFFVLILEREETITLHGGGIDFGLQATEGDPMCLHATKKNPNTGVTLPAGKYYVHLTGHYSSGDFYMYIDDINIVRHNVGPRCYIHPLNVDMSAQTASWGMMEKVFFCSPPNPGADFCYPMNPGWDIVSDRTSYLFRLDFDNFDFSVDKKVYPEGFPTSGYINGYAYKFDGVQTITIYCLETLTYETVPVVMSGLPADIVNEPTWSFNRKNMCFYAEVRTLDGSWVTIFIPVIGENRGVAQVSIVSATGSGNISQLLRLN